MVSKEDILKQLMNNPDLLNSVNLDGIKRQVEEQIHGESLILLKSPEFLKYIQQSLDFKTFGETNNRLLLFCLGCTSQFEKPQAVVVTGESAAGKTHLVESVLKLFPDEWKISEDGISNMTSKSLYYMTDDLSNKIMYIHEFDGIKDEEVQAALRVLISEGRLEIAETIGDPKTGHVTVFKKKEGSPFVITTTVRSSMEHQFGTRVWILAPDENEAKRKGIRQWDIDHESDTDVELKAYTRMCINIQNALNLLKKDYIIKIPFLSFIDIPMKNTKAIRDWHKIKALIKVIALLHQYQRMTYENGKQKFLFASIRDAEIAFNLIRDDIAALLLGISKITAQYYEKLKEKFEETTFTAVDARIIIGKSERRTREILNDLAYIGLVHKEETGGGKGKQNIYKMLENIDTVTVDNTINSIHDNYNKEHLINFLNKLHIDVNEFATTNSSMLEQEFKDQGSYTGDEVGYRRDTGEEHGGNVKSVCVEDGVYTGEHIGGVRCHKTSASIAGIQNRQQENVDTNRRPPIAGFAGISDSPLPTPQDVEQFTGVPTSAALSILKAAERPKKPKDVVIVPRPVGPSELEKVFDEFDKASADQEMDKFVKEQDELYEKIKREHEKKTIKGDPYANAEYQAKG